MGGCVCETHPRRRILPIIDLEIESRASTFHGMTDHAMILRQSQYCEIYLAVGLSCSAISCRLCISKINSHVSDATTLERASWTDLGRSLCTAVQTSGFRGWINRPQLVGEVCTALLLPLAYLISQTALSNLLLLPSKCTFRMSNSMFLLILLNTTSL